MDKSHCVSFVLVVGEQHVAVVSISSDLMSQNAKLNRSTIEHVLLKTIPMMRAYTKPTFKVLLWRKQLYSIDAIVHAFLTVLRFFTYF